MKFIGAMTGTMSGSLGGVTASHNRGGQYLRQRVVPTNPATARQNQVRAYLAGANSAWTMLTDAQRMGWATYASNVPTVDSLGQTIYLTGQQMFIRAWTTQMWTAGATPPTTAPAIFDRGANVVAFTSDTGSSLDELEIDATDVGMGVEMSDVQTAGGYVILFIGKPVAPTIHFYKGPYQAATSVLWVGAATTLNFDPTIASLTIDEPLVDGQRRPVRLVSYATDGRVSADYRRILTVVDVTP